MKRSSPPIFFLALALGCSLGFPPLRANPRAADARATMEDYHAPVLGLAAKYRHRSLSSSGQFVIYCPDVGLRTAVNRYVEEIRTSVFQSLGMEARWRYPIVITMEPPSTTSPRRELSELRYVETIQGPKIDLSVLLKEDRFREVRFPQLVIRALLIELAVRHHLPGLNDPVPEPPQWLVEGLAGRFYARNTEQRANTALFRQLIDTGRLPPIASFLESQVATMDSTSLEIYSECSYSLIEMLASQPGGRKSLGLLAAGLGTRKPEDDSVDLLLRYFPSLGGNEAALEKWWTLGVARFSARMTTLSVAETDAELQKLLTLDLVVHPVHQSTHPFQPEEYALFLRFPAAPLLLQDRSRAIAVLQAQAHPLMRPVLLEYQRILLELAQKRVRRIDEALAEVRHYRQVIVRHMGEVTDYMNWFEATQIPHWSGAFDGYLRTARQLEAPPVSKRDDALTRYMDQVQREFE